MSETEIEILGKIAELSQEISALRAENKLLKEMNERLFVLLGKKTEVNERK